MNCKPGDLAVMVGDGGAVNSGRFFRVIGRAPWQPDDDFWWEVEPLSRVWSHASQRFMAAGTVGLAKDRHLRPIRDPGDDAVDEMLRPLPAALPEVAA